MFQKFYTCLSNVYIDAGANQTCALDTNGAATCWGLNNNGQLEPPEDATFLQVDTAGVMSCGLLTNREVVCWTDDDRRFPQKLVGPFIKIDLRSGGV
jgi:alpha-tubulin suppressor-like RCC1 family protein